MMNELLKIVKSSSIQKKGKEKELKKGKSNPSV